MKIFNMCGIVGLARSRISHEYGVSVRKFFTEALFVDEVRGHHSTGVAGIPKEGVNLSPVVLKEAMPANTFIRLKDYEKWCDKAYNYRFLIGHNRYATRGWVNRHTAHPFVYNNIIMVHNGTLDTVNYLPEAKENTVDSARIAVALAEWGAKKTLERLHGAYALVWYDTHRKKLYMARNEERPLSFGFTDKGDYMVFGSEIDMLLWCGDRNGINITKWFDLHPGYLISFDEDMADFREYGHEKFEIYEPPSSSKRAPGFGGQGYVPPTFPESQKRTKKGKKSKTAYEVALDTQKDRINAQLEPWGVKVGDEVDFMPTEFVPYTENGKKLGTGVLYGVAEVGDRETLDVEVYHFKASEHKDEHEWYKGKVWNAYERSDDKVVISILANQCHVSVYSVEGEDDDWDAFALDSHGFRKSDRKSYKRRAKILGPNNILITPEEFVAFTKDGCVKCTAPVLITEDHKLKWTSDNRPYCPECVAEAEKKGQPLVHVVH